MEQDSLRILMLIDQFFPILGGAEQQALRISKELTRRGFKVSVLTRKSRTELAETEIYEDIRIHRLPFVGAGSAPKLKSTSPAAAWLVKNRAYYDIIHCHGSNPLEWSAMVAGRITKKPYVLKLTNPNFMNYAGANNGFKMKSSGANSRPNEPVRTLMLPALRFMRRNMVKHASRVLAISPQIAGCLARSGFNNVSYIPNGIDTEFFRPVAPVDKSGLRSKLGLDSGATTFLYAGRLAVEKNLMTLLKAWNQFTASNPGQKAQLLFLGDSNGQVYSAEDELREYARENNLSSLKFTGSVLNVDEYLQASDIFVLPSYWEGMSNALLEAMACGLPSIVSDIPANSALVANGSSGLTFPAEDVEALVKCLTALAANPDIRVDMGDKAREIAVEKFSFPAIIDGISEIYGAILGYSVSSQRVL
ncbi:MAG TPA: glycosyltransferase family 1 protein [candidate division Zixibacteria bacterium]|nr:glycosyltransferase family 1 protein [candidate division Zixibacteria bacterium]HER00132.1 glycosyltransferase family 1 protein [candidate division Zixibacteria bacterium]